jgi:hypothetical protein
MGLPEKYGVVQKGHTYLLAAQAAKRLFGQQDLSGAFL